MKKTITQRIKAITVIILAIFPCIIVRLFEVQVISHSHYAQEASRNLDKYRDITPRRGAIYDRSGEFLVKTVPAHNIMMKPGNVTPVAEENLGVLLSIPPEEIHSKVAEQLASCNQEIEKAMRKYANLPSKKYAQQKRSEEKDYLNRKYLFCKNIPPEFALKLFYQKKMWVPSDETKVKLVDNFSGFELEQTAARQYPCGDLLVHLLGSVGSLSREQYRTLGKSDYRITDTVGRSGLEMMFEDKLRGRRGCVVDSREGDVFTEYPTDGRDVILTIDANAQQVAEQSLDKMLSKTTTASGGAAVVVDIVTGDIIVLATTPRYQNEKFGATYDSLSKDERRPLENRAIRSYFPPSPGSVFKIMVGIYALEHGIIDEQTSVYCRGYLHRPDQFRCTHVHHQVNIVAAVAKSCNVFFYQVGETMGLERLADCARLFGYGEKTGIGLSDEYAGQVPVDSRDSAIADARMFGIGQIMTTTPLQMAYAVAMFANMGEMPPVRLVKQFRIPRDRFQELDPESGEPSELAASTIEEVPPKQEKHRLWPIQPRNWQLIAEGMRRVVESPEGTASEIKPLLGKIRIASKTGTAQCTDGNRADHAWFAGYAPLESPQYAFVVFIEHGGYGGKAAAPVAVDILRSLLEPRK